MQFYTLCEANSMRRRHEVFGYGKEGDENLKIVRTQNLPHSKPVLSLPGPQSGA